MNVTLRLVLALTTLALCAGCTSRDTKPPAPPAASPATTTTATATSSAGCTGRLVTNAGVGPIRIFASLDSIRQICPIVRDTTVQPQPGLAAEHLVSVLMGTDTAVVGVRRGRVVQIFLTGTRFATADSIGVGTTLARLLRFAQTKGYGVAGDLLIATPTKCGLTFGMTGRYPDLPDGLKDSTALSRVPVTATVNRVRVDGCDRDEDAESSAPDDSTYDVQTDSVFVSRDLDGNGATDFVVRESRPFGRSRQMLVRRLAVYLDSIPASRRPRWSSGWDMEGEALFGEVHPLAHGSMVLLLGNDADYSSETVLAIRDGAITEELTHGEDYGHGGMRILTEGGKLVVEATLDHLMVRGKPFSPQLECKSGEWALVRMTWDESARKFIAERPTCVKERLVGQ
jgi:hypothetical protein